jgi:Raf kinase inhibitor-like YbhB/YbcL family protein
MWTVKSSAFEPEASIPKRHTGDGDDVSPALSWSEPPAGTAELALVVDDPDAPSPEPWVHWVLYKIPPRLRALPEGILPTRSVTSPAGLLQGKNSWGTIGWKGPAPPRGHGLHHYHFRLYALDAALPDRAGLEVRELRAAMRKHVLGEARITGLYQR